MSLVIAVIAWAAIGAIAGLVAPIFAATFSRDRVLRTVGFGAALAVLCGLVAYGVNALFDDDGAGSAFYGGSSVLFVIVLIALFSYEKQRSAQS